MIYTIVLAFFVIVSSSLCAQPSVDPSIGADIVASAQHDLEIRQRLHRLLGIESREDPYGGSTQLLSDDEKVLLVDQLKEPDSLLVVANELIGTNFRSFTMLNSSSRFYACKLLAGLLRNIDHADIDGPYDKNADDEQVNTVDGASPGGQNLPGGSFMGHNEPAVVSANSAIKNKLSNIMTLWVAESIMRMSPEEMNEWLFNIDVDKNAKYYSMLQDLGIIPGD